MDNSGRRVRVDDTSLRYSLILLCDVSKADKMHVQYSNSPAEVDADWRGRRVQQQRCSERDADGQLRRHEGCLAAKSEVMPRVKDEVGGFTHSNSRIN